MLFEVWFQKHLFILTPLSFLPSFPKRDKDKAPQLSLSNQSTQPERELHLFIATPYFYPRACFLLLYIFVLKTSHTHENNYKMKDCGLVR